MGKNPNGKIPDYDYSISTIHQLYFREIEAHRVSKVRKGSGGGVGPSGGRGQTGGAGSAGLTGILGASGVQGPPEVYRQLPVRLELLGPKGAPAYCSSYTYSRRRPVTDPGCPVSPVGPPANLPDLLNPYHQFHLSHPTEKYQSMFITNVLKVTYRFSVLSRDTLQSLLSLLSVTSRVSD